MTYNVFGETLNPTLLLAVGVYTAGGELQQERRHWLVLRLCGAICSNYE